MPGRGGAGVKGGDMAVEPSCPLCRGRMVPDLLAVLGAMDFVLADIDR